MRYLLIVLLLIFTGCSSKKLPNTWEHKSASSTKSYIHYYLQERDTLAKAEYKRAIKSAKQSASLDTLAKIYLTKCSLNHLLYVEDSCQEYLEIKHLLDDKSLDNYYQFISNKPFDSADLPEQYREFALTKDMTSKKKVLFEMESLYSQLLAASLIKDELNDKDILELLKRSSYHGYRRVNLVLLERLAQTTSSEKLKKESLEKIEILNR